MWGGSADAPPESGVIEITGVDDHGDHHWFGETGITDARELQSFFTDNRFDASLTFFLIGSIFRQERHAYAVFARGG